MGERQRGSDKTFYKEGAEERGRDTEGPTTMEYPSPAAHRLKALLTPAHSGRMGHRWAIGGWCRQPRQEGPDLGRTVSPQAAPVRQPQARSLASLTSLSSVSPLQQRRPAAPGAPAGPQGREASTATGDKHLQGGEKTQGREWLCLPLENLFALTLSKKGCLDQLQCIVFPYPLQLGPFPEPAHGKRLPDIQLLSPAVSGK